MSDPGWADAPGAREGEADRALAASLAGAGLAVQVVPPPDPPAGRCGVLGWADSGAMWLTGRPGEPPAWPPGDVVGRLEAAGRALSALAAGTGAGVAVDAGGLLGARAGWRGWARRGPISAGGRSRLLAAADGWVAVTLSRPTDVASVPALVGDDGAGAADGRTRSWGRVAAWARCHPAAAVASRAQLLGVPAGPVPPGRARPVAPWTVTRLGPASDRRRDRPLVVDFSAMWAGPLCAHLLGRAGARVVKVEDPARPDAARLGDRRLFDLLHQGHESVSVAFTTPDGRDELRRLVAEADVVIEASRPRALEALGFAPAAFCAARPGRTWVSITGHGRRGPRANWVAFGDDAAAAGGLVARDRRGDPVFCADAAADPVSGLYAAVGALASLSAGGGHLVDCAMARAAAYAGAGASCRRPHGVEHDGEGWVVAHLDRAGGSARVRQPCP